MSCTITFNNIEYSLSDFKDKLESGEIVIPQSIYLNTGEVPQTKASPTVIKRVKELLKRMGVDLETLTKEEGKRLAVHLSGNERGMIDGIANMFEKVVGIVEGKEDVALTEEAAHFVVEIVQKTNPTLFKQMMQKIGGYKIYYDTLRLYSGNELYRNKDGSVNGVALKKEAIGKLLAEYIIKGIDGEATNTDKVEDVAFVQSWWEKVLNWFKELFVRHFNPFEELATSVINETFEGTADILTEEGVFLNYSNPQREIIDNINRVKEKLKHIITVDEGGKELNYYEYDGKLVPNRVTDLAKSYYRKQFGKTDTTDEDNSFKAKGGIGIHADIEDIIRRATDEDGILIKTPQGGIVLKDSELSAPNTGDMVFYKALEDNIKKRLEMYPEGTAILTETPIYDAKFKDGEGIAGSVDFIVILPTGETDIIDWKSINLREKETDIPFYKREPWQKQISEYKRILTDYGVDEFRYTRAVPIVVTYHKGGDNDGKLSSLKIGNADVKLEQYDYLLPLPLQEESTGDTSLDKLIKELYALYTQYKDIKVEKKNKAIKAKQANDLYSSIRRLHAKRELNGVVDQVNLAVSQAEHTLERGNNALSTDISPEEINALGDRFDFLNKALKIYSEIGDLNIFENPTEDEVAISQKLKQASDSATRKLKQLKSLQNKVADKYISRGVNNLLLPEKVETGLSKWMNILSNSNNRAMRVLWRMVSEVKGRVNFRLNREIERLEEFRTLSYQEISKILKKDSKGKNTNFLIDQYQKEFYDTLKKKIEESDLAWIKDNVDKERLQEWATSYREEQLKELRETIYAGTPEEQERRRKEDIEDVISLTDLTHSYAWLQYNNLKKFPTNKWFTPEYNSLTGKTLELYNYIREWNRKATETGYLHGSQERNFLPFVPASFADKLTFGNNVNFIEGLFNSLTESSETYDKYDELSGDKIESLPSYFTNEISNYSGDIIKNMALYIGKVIDYEIKAELEPQIKLLQFVEKNKDHLETNKFGNVVKGAAVLKGNDENAELLNSHIRRSFYGQRDADARGTEKLLGNIIKPYNKISDSFFNKTGIRLPKIDEDEKSLSSSKLLDASVTIFRLKALGLNVASSFIQFLGGSASAIINAGTYYTKGQAVANEFRHASNAIFKNNKLGLALMAEFLPVENQLRQRIKKLSHTNKFTQSSFSDMLMSLMTTADNLIQFSNFLSFMDNTIVIDGVVTNARQYYRGSEEYKNRYNLPEQERISLEKEFEAKITSLLKENSIYKYAKEKEGKLIIEGIELDNPSLLEYKELIEQVGKQLAGNITREDASKITMNAIGRSIMLFKNWIPGNVQQRYGALKYNEGTQQWQWGRASSFGRFLSFRVINSINEVSNILKGTDKGIAVMDEMYERERGKFIEKKGLQNASNKQIDAEFLTKEEFYDLVRKNTRMQLKEILILSNLMILFMLAGQLPPEDDDDKSAKAFFNYQMRVLDRLQDEISFYYNPITLEKLLGGSVFPAIGILKDGKNILSNLAQEGFGAISGNEEIQEKAHPTKYIMKAIPLSSQLLVYLTFFNPELAKELGVKSVRNNPY